MKLFLHAPLHEPDILACVLGADLPPSQAAALAGHAALTDARGVRIALVPAPGEGRGALGLYGLVVVAAYQEIRATGAGTPVQETSVVAGAVGSEVEEIPSTAGAIPVADTAFGENRPTR